MTANDADRRERFARSMERVRTVPGIPDDLDEIDRLLAAVVSYFRVSEASRTVRCVRIETSPRYRG